MDLIAQRGACFVHVHSVCPDSVAHDCLDQSDEIGVHPVDLLEMSVAHANGALHHRPGPRFELTQDRILGIGAQVSEDRMGEDVLEMRTLYKKFRGPGLVMDNSFTMPTLINNYLSFSIRRMQGFRRTVTILGECTVTINAIIIVKSNLIFNY